MTLGKTPSPGHDAGYGTPPVHTGFRKADACPQARVSRRVNADADVVERERMHRFSASGPADAIPCSAPSIPCYPAEQGSRAKALILLDYLPAPGCLEAEIDRKSRKFAVTFPVFREFAPSYGRLCNSAVGLKQSAILHVILAGATPAKPQQIPQSLEAIPAVDFLALGIGAAKILYPDFVDTPAARQ
jgi:hypothetical protein